MPILIPESLPSRWMLDSEGIFVIDQSSALRQDIRPLQIAIVDASHKQYQELGRILSQSSLQIELTFISVRPGADFPGRFLHPDQLATQTFDGIILADRPEATAQGPDWDELRDILDWAVERVKAHLYLGLSAQAALRHFYNVPRSASPRLQGVQGVVHRAVRANSFLLRGFNEEFQVLVQEAHGIDRDDILDVQGLELLAESKGGEPYLVRNYDRSRVFALHFPSEAVLPFEIAERGTWLSHRALLLRNWINYYVYQPVSQFLQERDGRPAA